VPSDHAGKESKGSTMGGLTLTWIDAIGYLGACFSIATFSMKTIIPLRVFGITSNVIFIIYSLSNHVYPSLLVNAVLLPLNAWRLREMLRLVKKVRAASGGDLSMEWLKPFMSRRAVAQGEVLFERDAVADAMFYALSGRYRLRELGIDIGPGQVVGELGLLAPENRRTATLECTEAGEVLSIGYQQVRELYFQNPEFGFYFLRLTTERLFQNISRLQGELQAARTPERVRAEGR
jgi:CRP/FNR family cyclic AMP-dependent transcriptional regulator